MPCLSTVRAANAPSRRIAISALPAPICSSVLLLFRRGGTLKTVHMPGGTIPPHDGHGPLHVAFAVTAEALREWEERLRDHGVAIEFRTDWSRGRRSIYFRDLDGHVLELATPGLWATY